MKHRDKKAPPPAKPNPSALPVVVREGDNVAAAVAQTILRPTAQAACTVESFNRGTVEVAALIGELAKQTDAVNGGDLKRAEAMLISQAHALDAIFGYCARRAAVNFGDYLNAGETYLRLALKAQGQCRATLETLAQIKFPSSVAFVRQANIAAGPQQVNNAVTPGPVLEGSRAGETQNEQGRLLEATNAERLDGRTSSEAGKANSSLEAVGAVHRAPDAGRQGEGS